MDIKPRLLVAVLALSLALPGCARIFESEASSKLVQAIASTGANFKESYRINVLVEPADLELYREVLPSQFDMPEHPLVQVIMLDQVDVGPWPLTPYKEGSVNLLCEYRGQQGWHITELPVNTWVAKYAGRTMGYPKYLADKVTFEQAGDKWVSEVIHDGEMRLKVEFTPGDWEEEPVWQKNGWDMGGPVLNLMPPGEGPEVVAVGSSGEMAPSAEITKGSVRIWIGKNEPWAGLIPPGTEAPGEFIHVTEARSLAPEEK
jgi:hypothetical protein